MAWGRVNEVNNPVSDLVYTGSYVCPHKGVHGGMPQQRGNSTNTGNKHTIRITLETSKQDGSSGILILLTKAARFYQIKSTLVLIFFLLHFYLFVYYTLISYTICIEYTRV
jgi:hypothetical protein